MKTFKGTPGRWQPNGGLIGIYVQGRKSWTLVADTMDDGDSGMEVGEAEANTNLVAAAPEMLEALQLVEAWWLDVGMHSFLGAPAAMFAAREAIRKALGEDQ